MLVYEVKRAKRKQILVPMTMKRITIKTEAMFQKCAQKKTVNKKPYI